MGANSMVGASTRNGGLGMECGVCFVYPSERMCQSTNHWPLTEQEGEAELLALRGGSLVIVAGAGRCIRSGHEVFAACQSLITSLLVTGCVKWGKGKLRRRNSSSTLSRRHNGWG